MSKIGVAPVAGIIVVASIMAFYPVKNYFNTRNEFLTEYKRIIATPYDSSLQEPVFDPIIDELIASNSDKRFLTKKRKEILLFQKAFLNRLNNDAYLQFKQNYPENPKIPFLDSLYSSLFFYRIEPSQLGDFCLDELIPGLNDTTFGKSFNISSFQIVTNDYEKDTLLLKFELIDQNENKLDYYDLRYGSIVRLNGKITHLPSLELKIPDRWQILNYIQPKLIVIKGEDLDQGSQTVIKDYFPGMTIEEINNELLPREYKIIPYVVSQEKVWGILSFEYSASFQKTNWQYRDKSEHYNLTDVRFVNINNYSTSWDKLNDSYMERFPDGTTNDANAWIKIGSLAVLPPFRILK